MRRRPACPGLLGTDRWVSVVTGSNFPVTQSPPVSISLTNAGLTPDYSEVRLTCVDGVSFPSGARHVYVAAKRHAGTYTVRAVSGTLIRDSASLLAVTAPAGTAHSWHRELQGAAQRSFRTRS